MIDKRKKKYKTFINKIDQFIALCEDKNILARRNWTCCNTCGTADMEKLVKDLEQNNPDKTYLGYIFYHDQEADCIEENLESSNDVMIWLNWGYCHDEDEEDDIDGIALAQTIHQIAVDNGYILEFTDLRQKLRLGFTVS